MSSTTATGIGVTRAIRTAAGLAVLVLVAGGALFAAAVLATQGPWYAGYVSESGVAGQPYQVPYRLGLVALAAGLVLLAGALRPLARLAAAAVLLSGVLAAVSGAVTCSAGCPLPPFETPATGDVVHGAASVLGVALCALAILLIAAGRADTALRRVSRAALVPVVVTGLTNAYGLALVGRSYLTGTAERVMLVLIITWSLAAALSIGRGRRAAGEP